MRHCGRGGRAVPVFFAGREQDHIAGTNFLNRSAVALRPAAAGGHDHRLPERVRVPCSSSARLERHTCAGDARGLGTIKKRIDSNRPREPICGTFAGGL